MDSGLSTVRNLLWMVLVLGVLGVLSNFYVAAELERSNNELASIRLLVQKQLMGDVMAQSVELQKRMEDLNQTAGGVGARIQQAQDQMDAKLQKAQDDFVARMKVDLPNIMDDYVKHRTPELEDQAKRQLQKRGVPVQ